MSDLTKTAKGDFHLGYSRISAYLECPRKFQYTYIDGIRVKAGTALRRGQAYHAVLEKLLKYKAKHGALARLDQVEAYALKCAKAEDLSDSESSRVVDAARFYYAEMYPKHQPLAVEEAFDIVRGGVRITGRIDLIETNGLITDHKFSYDIWAEPRAKHGCQPIIYQWAAMDAIKQKYNVDYTGFCYNIIRLFPTPLIQRIEIPLIDGDASAWWEEQIALIAQSIRSGIFPANASDKSCGWCDHKKRCKPTIYKTKIDTYGTPMCDEE